MICNSDKVFYYVSLFVEWVPVSFTGPTPNLSLSDRGFKVRIEVMSNRVLFEFSFVLLK